MTKAAFSVAEFCREHGISRGLFYRLLREGHGPRVIKAGTARVRWHRAKEKLKAARGM